MVSVHPLRHQFPQSHRSEWQVTLALFWTLVQGDGVPAGAYVSTKKVVVPLVVAVELLKLPVVAVPAGNDSFFGVASILTGTMPSPVMCTVFGCRLIPAARMAAAAPNTRMRDLICCTRS